MTEILEKALMIGFGITILLFFLSITSPFFKLIENYKFDSDLKKNLMCISIINSGTFQYQTSYQKSMNINPTTGSTYIVNLQSLQRTNVDFKTFN